MTDYGRPLQFGLFVSPSAALLDNTFKLASVADESLDFIGIQDHPYQSKFLDAFALMGAVVARTRRVRVIPDVASLPLRPPAFCSAPPTTTSARRNGSPPTWCRRCGTPSNGTVNRGSAPARRDGRNAHTGPLLWPRRRTR